MATYTYTDAKRGVLPKGGDIVYLHGLKYELCGGDWFFYNYEGENSDIFHKIGWSDPNQFFLKVLEDGNFKKASISCASPYALTADNARKILIRIWESPIFEVGTVVKIRADLEKGYNYAVCCNSSMVECAGKYAKITSIKVSDVRSDVADKSGLYLEYSLEPIDSESYETDFDWVWTEDMLERCHTTEIEYPATPKDSIDMKKEDLSYTIVEPKSVALYDLATAGSQENTSIQLPNHSKHLTITL